MIGSNARGKTNLIEALRILSESAAGHPLSVICDGSRNTAGSIRGGSIRCPQMPKNDFELGCTWEGAAYKLVYRIKVNVQGRVQVSQESLTKVYDDGKEEKIFATASKNGDYSIVQFLSDRIDDCIREIGVSANMSVLSQAVNLFPSDSKALVNGREDAQRIIQTLKNIFFFHPETRFMRDYVRLGERKLKPDGSNLSAVLYGLCHPEIEENNCKSDILSVIRKLPDNEIRDIAFVKTELNDVIFFLKEKYNNYPIDARQLSDGILRCLAMLVLVYSEEPGSVIVMEEMENGIHPSRIMCFLQAVFRIARERQITLVLTTHNPVLMDMVDEDNAEGVVICYRNRKDGSSDIQRMVDFPDYYRLAARGAVGELARNDEFVKAIYRPQDDNRDFFSWLEK